MSFNSCHTLPLNYCFVVCFSSPLQHRKYTKDLEHRHGLLLCDVWQYEANAIFMDCLVFFTVGRLWQQRGVDNLEFIGIAMAANVYTSYVATFPMFRYRYVVVCMFVLEKENGSHRGRLLFARSY
jgi:hypothetical protein